MNTLTLFYLDTSIMVCLVLFSNWILFDLFCFFMGIDWSFCFFMSMMQFSYQNSCRYTLFRFVQLLLTLFFILFFLIFFCFNGLFFRFLFRTVNWCLYETVSNFFAFSFIQFAYSVDFLNQLFILFKILFIKLLFFLLFIIICQVFKHCKF